MKYVIITIVAIAVAIVLGMSIESGKDDARKWAEGNGMTVLNVEVHITPIGTPFFYANKGSYIYEIDVITKEGEKEKWWMRTGIFSNDIEKG